MPLLIALFVAVPILELYLIIKVGSWLGVLPTIGILIADSIVGATLLRSQGARAWRRFNQALAEGRFPRSEVLDGVMIVFGGALLLTPGFFTDVFGLLLLLPPTRALLRRTLVAGVVRRMAAGSRIVFWSAGGRPGEAAEMTRDPSAPAYDVEGTATEVRREDPPPHIGPRQPLNP